VGIIVGLRPVKTEIIIIITIIIIIITKNASVNRVKSLLKNLDALQYTRI